MRITSTAAAAALLAALAACTSTAPARSDPPVGSGPPAVSGAPGPTGTGVPAHPAAGLPLMDFELTPAEDLDVDRALTLVSNRCLTRSGVRAFLHPESQPQADRLDRRYGVTDPAVAARYGYHVPPGTQLTGRVPPDAAPTAAEKRVYLGPDGSGRDGCAGEASRALGFADLAGPDPERLLDRGDQESFLASRRDRNVLAVTAAWSACMGAHGHPAADPIEVAGTVDIDTPQPTAAEIALATTDVACKRAHDVVAVWLAAERSH